MDIIHNKPGGTQCKDDQRDLKLTENGGPNITLIK